MNNNIHIYEYMDITKNLELFYKLNKLIFWYIIFTILLIFFIIYIYMRYVHNKKKVIVFDLDETLGCFVQLGVFCDAIDKYKNYNRNKKMPQSEFNDIFKLFPEYLRPNILKILMFLKEKKENGDIHKVYIYTNNQGPKEWAEKIIKFLENQIDYKLFDKIIGAYKVNNKIVEPTRTTYNKTVSDFYRSTNISKKSKICFIDDLYHPDMDDKNVTYIQINPYQVALSPLTLIQRYYSKNNANIPTNKYHFSQFINNFMNQYDLNLPYKGGGTSQTDMEAGTKLYNDIKLFVGKKSTIKSRIKPERCTYKNKQNI